MIAFYKKIFYWLHYYVGKIKTNDMPAYSAYLVLCFFQMFNVLTLLILLNHLLDVYNGGKFFFDSGKGKYTMEGLFIGLILALPFLIFNYMFYLKKEKKEQILSDNLSLSDRRKRRDKLIFWLYIVLSIAFPVLLIYFL